MDIVDINIGRLWRGLQSGDLRLRAELGGAAADPRRSGAQVYLQCIRRLVQQAQAARFFVERIFEILPRDIAIKAFAIDVSAGGADKQPVFDHATADGKARTRFFTFTLTERRLACKLVTGLVGGDHDSAGDGIAPVKIALWAFQYLYLLDIE